MPSSLKKKPRRPSSSKNAVSRKNRPEKPAEKANPSVTAWVEVRETEVGKGVFSTRRILEGTVIAKIEGKVIEDPNHSSNYCMDLGGDFSLEPYAPYRFLNHSCTPNCSLVSEDFTGKSADNVPTIWLESISVILPGEELTIDYAWPAYHAIECLCGSADCRGWIVDASELAQVKKQKGKTASRRV